MTAGETRGRLASGTTWIVGHLPHTSLPAGHSVALALLCPCPPPSPHRMEGGASAPSLQDTKAQSPVDHCGRIQ